MQINITETRESEAHKKSGHTARANWRKENPRHTRYNHVPTRFICIDGEGVTLPDGTHRYVLLGIGDQQISNPQGLSLEEIFEFLWDQFLEHGTKSVAYTGFFLSYDFIQWVKNLPENRARMLLTKEGIAARKPKSKNRVMPFPVRYGEWEFDMLGTKRFSLRKAGSKRWMKICDTGPFFQKAFLKVIDPANWSEPVVSPDEYDKVVEGKGKRSTARLDRDMYIYNSLENEILARVLCRLNEGFQSLGIHLKPSQWFGPGQAAQSWLETRSITRELLEECTPTEVLECAKKSYFGGWFEIMAHGPIPGITYEYDVNSAYPYIISTLPCLEHGEWVNENVRGKYTLVYAKVSGSDPYIGAMLHRDRKGNILRPDRTEGWYWWHEIQAAQAAGLISEIQITNSWTYRPCDCPAPFREVSDIYTLRQQVGKTTPLGIACKLVPNSLYGKFAQSVGNPKFANPIYASLITAGCRTMILNAIASHPGGAEDVLMVATDGVYFRSRHNSLRVSDRLGDWDEARKTNITLFKPGVYWDDKARAAIKDGKAPVFKARGVSANDLSKKIEQIDRLFHNLVIVGNLDTDDILDDKWPVIKYPVQFAMTTALQALHRNAWDTAGTLIPDAEGKQSAHPGLKRDRPYFRDDILRTHPRANEPYEKSQPYEKRFGMEDPFSELYLEKNGVTPDGMVGQLFREALNI